MKFRIGRSLVWTAILSAALSAAPVAPSPPQDSSLVARQIIPKLSDESFAIREAATRELWALGEAVVPELRDLAAGRDPEAAIRARELLRKIELGVLPDSSPKIVDLVMRYDRGSLDERQRVVLDLRNERAFRQILKLYALEKDQDSITMLESSVRGVAIDAARDCLASNPPDVKGAFTYLKMARPEASEYMAMASLHRSVGTLDEELKNAAETQGQAGHLWRYALLATAGKLPEAAAEAEEAGLTLAAARLHLISGDPVPWLKQAPASPQAVNSSSLPDYRDFAVSNWEGKRPNPELVRKFRSMARAGDEDDQAKGLMMMFLTGDYVEAEKLLQRRDPMLAFYYLDSAERVDEALEQLEIDPKNPDYTGWARKRFDVLIEEPDSEDHETQELCVLGYFLERRGLHKELEEAFVPPLVELSANSQENFLMAVTRFLSEDSGFTVVEPVLTACAKFAGEDEVRWMQVIENLFGSGRSAGEVWHWLGDLDPAMTSPERLDLMARIFGCLPEVEDKLLRFREKAWLSIGKAEANEKRRLLTLLAGISIPRKPPHERRMGDVETFVRCVDELEKLEGGAGDWKVKQADYLGWVGRWQESAKFCQEFSARMPGEPAYWGYAAASLRAAGDESAALEHEKKAELLAMGETRALKQVGEAFALCGDFERARQWWQRAAEQCTNDQSSFFEIMEYLADDALAREDWKTAAALEEARTLQMALPGRSLNILSSVYARHRLESDMLRAFARMGTDKDPSVAKLQECLEAPFADVLLADYFFAPMRRSGLLAMHDEAFEKSWKKLTEIMARFPDGENTRNSAAWLASRANRRLDEAEEVSKHALEISPKQAAYLDTMAEIQFARGDRGKAVEFSARGLREDPWDMQLIRQHKRFENGAFPPK
jgi:tetratricopeptide (TPR) repeat protein